MSKSPIDYLLHILDECKYLTSNPYHQLSLKQFQSDETLKRAATRSLEIIGEATKNLSSSFRADNPHVPWKNMSGMRDRLIHDYMGINYRLVWDVITNLIPQLHLQIKEIIAKHSE
ncbi:unnamed protein product [Ectocarpus sp. 12 AP-2014]